MPVKRDAFVIMPFSPTKSCDDWTDIYQNVFSPAICAAGYTCERANVTTGSLIKSIVERLRNARLVIADITDHNPNVFYELGVRHSLSRRTIIVAQSADHIPSDLRGYWSIIYGTKPKAVLAFADDIRRVVSVIDLEPDKSDSPVSDYLERATIDILRETNIRNTKKLNALLVELGGNKISLERLLTLKSKKKPFSLIEYNCLTLLLQSLYLDIGPYLISLAYELKSDLKLIEAGFFEDQRAANALQHIAKLVFGIRHIRQRVMCNQYIEPPDVTNVYWEGYSIDKPSISSDDIAGIRTYYCPRHKSEHLDATTDNNELVRTYKWEVAKCELCRGSLRVTFSNGDKADCPVCCDGTSS